MMLQDLIKQAKQGLDLLTFSIENCQTAVSPVKKSVIIQATCDNGQVVTFWESNMDRCVEVIDEKAGKYQVKAGVQIAADGGLIPEGSSFKGFFS